MFGIILSFRHFPATHIEIAVPFEDKFNQTFAADTVQQIGLCLWTGYLAGCCGKRIFGNACTDTDFIQISQGIVEIAAQIGRASCRERV